MGKNRQVQGCWGAGEKLRFQWDDQGYPEEGAQRRRGKRRVGLWV